MYSLIPNGHHSQYPDDLPAFDGSDSSSPFGIPKQSIVSILYGTGQFGATFTPTVDQAFRCLFAPEPFETAPECQDPIDNILPEFLSDRSAYYQNQWFARIASDPSYRIPVFNAGTLTDPLFPPVENLRMSNRIQAAVPGYPIQQYFGDYQHFVQNKAKEWGDLCGADHHVCTIADYPGGDVNATPAGLYRTGVTTRLNRFVDHFAQPAGNPSQPQPSYNVTTALQICPQNASAGVPGERARADLHGRQVLPARAPYVEGRHRRHADDDQRRGAEPARVAGGPAHERVHQRRPLPAPHRAGRPRRGRLRLPAARRARDDDRRHAADRRLHGLDGAGRAAERAPLRHLPGRHAGDGRPRSLPRGERDGPGHVRAARQRLALRGRPQVCDSS